MSFPLINPYQQFFDSSGAPLVSGTIEFRDPTSNDLINSYPTADDADAQTNANDNPLTLDASGAAASGLYLEDGVAYKVILKDAQGATVKTDDDVRCPIALPYLETAEETAASVTVVNIEYPPGNVLRYGTNTTPGTTDMTTAIQNAVDVMEAKGGGDVIVPPEIHLVTDTITINGPVWLRGSGAAYEEVFTASPTFSGSVIKLGDAAFTSASKAIVEFDYTGAGGESRLHAGAYNIGIFGNRGSTADPSDASANDNNTYGIGFHIKGARYVTLDTCFAVWCAEDGVKAITSVDPVNNVRILGGSYLSNVDDGIDFAGGDSFITDVQCGYNGGDGIAGGSLILNSVRCWDNFTNGVRSSSNLLTVTGGEFYDNQNAGILVSGTREMITIVGALCQDNGKDVSLTDQERSGIYVSGACTNSVISGVTSCNKDENGTTGQKYGVRITNTASRVAVGPLAGDNNGTALYSNLASGPELTLATDAITVEESSAPVLFYRIDTQADAGTDDLATITGGIDGQVVVLKAADTARTVVVKNGTGNIELSGADFSMDNALDSITLLLAGSTWVEVSRSKNAAFAGSYAPSNVTPDRTFDADTVAVAELADIVGTLISDLQAKDLIG